jgi:hypothetical protein
MTDSGSRVFVAGLSTAVIGGGVNSLGYRPWGFVLTFALFALFYYAETWRHKGEEPK